MNMKAISIACVLLLLLILPMAAQTKKPVAAFKEVTYCVKTSDAATLEYVNASGGVETDRAHFHEHQDIDLKGRPESKTREEKMNFEMEVIKSYCSWVYTLKATPGARVGVQAVNDEGWVTVDVYVGDQKMRSAETVIDHGTAVVKLVVP